MRRWLLLLRGGRGVRSNGDRDSGCGWLRRSSERRRTKIEGPVGGGIVVLGLRRVKVGDLVGFVAIGIENQREQLRCFVRYSSSSSNVGGSGSGIVVVVDVVGVSGTGTACGSGSGSGILGSSQLRHGGWIVANQSTVLNDVLDEQDVLGAMFLDQEISKQGA